MSDVRQPTVEMYSLKELVSIRDAFLRELKSSVTHETSVSLAQKSDAGHFTQSTGLSAQPDSVSESPSGLSAQPTAMADIKKPISALFIRNQLPSHNAIPDNEIFQVIAIGGSHMKNALMQKKGDSINLLKKTKVKVPTFNDETTFLTFVEKHLNIESSHLVINLAQMLEPVIRGNIFDGRLVGSSKEHEFAGLIGKVVGEEVEKYIAQKLQRKIHVSVINDVTCLVLSGLQMSDWNIIVGGIVGTGVNFGYFLDRYTIINTESGAFRALRQTETGRALDKQSNKPGEFIFEKEVSGRYLFQHFNILLKDYQCSSTEKLSHIARSDDKNAQIAQKLFERSASLIATHMTAIFMYKSQKNLVFAMEGSLFWEGWNYENMVIDYIQKLGVSAGSIKMVNIEDNSLFGAAQLFM